MVTAYVRAVAGSGVRFTPWCGSVMAPMCEGFLRQCSLLGECLSTLMTKRGIVLTAGMEHVLMWSLWRALR